MSSTKYLFILDSVGQNLSSAASVPMLDQIQGIIKRGLYT